MNFTMHNMTPGTLKAGTVKNNLKGTIGRFVVSDNTLSFTSSVKGTPRSW